jgi:DNA-binding LacI/PurR family transcriptional regulator
MAGGAEIRSIAFIFDQSFSPLEPGWQMTLQAINDGVRKHVSQSRIVAFNTYGETPESIAKHECDALSFVEGERFDGVVMGHAGGDATIPLIRRILGGGTPVIFIDALPFKHGCDFVGIDNRVAAREAVEYLLRIGHRRIAFLAPEEKISTIEDRLAGYLDAMQGAGLGASSADLLWRPALAQSLTRDALTAEMNRIAANLSRSQDPPTAVFAVNDFLAHLLVQSLEKHGVSVPGSVSVMGFDDVDRYLPNEPFLTTVRQPFESLGLRAADMLWQRIESEDDMTGAFQHVILPTSLIVRDSTRPV